MNNQDLKRELEAVGIITNIPPDKLQKNSFSELRLQFPNGYVIWFQIAYESQFGDAIIEIGV